MRTWSRKSSLGGVKFKSEMDGHEAAVLRSLVESVTGLLDERASSAPQDELAALTTKLETDPTDEVVMRFGEVQARYQDLGGYRPGNVAIYAGIPTTWTIESTNPATCASFIRIPSLGLAGALRKGFQDQKFGHRQRHRLVLPGAGVAFRVHPEMAALERARVDFLRRDAVLRRGAP